MRSNNLCGLSTDVHKQKFKLYPGDLLNRAVDPKKYFFQSLVLGLEYYH